MQISTSTRVAIALVAANFFNEILPVLAQVRGGTGEQSTGQSSGIEAFVSKRSVRNTWIAFWILWIIWSLISLLDYATRDRNHNRGADGVESGDRNNPRNKGFARFGNGGNGAERAASLARDLLLGLLSALVLNTFARGSGVAVEILTWFYLGIAIIMLLVEIFVDSKIVQVFFGIVEFGLLLTIISLSYRFGWRFFNAA
ncbi:hypothetical protein RclHR1_08090003 [Rhizophagus clarus]|uniref:Uncharacterized protein n=1 Tax=Rhizophagus clarus TaxID=94130 RepID=A0A2Z6SMV0_9GLOM|nr:hypothetical protein RclHR1_08090003 [Rhizophagus clarus]GES89671.1 hypothetical protein GLOIN_2v1673655 [Rhizophagus clarus]